ncbi:MAG: IS66 family insertion sequence element accessory protein TnpB [Ruminococcaceae bacterium]|jgi:hypothetical protein|nr:IS66 family insertion sequence element accessory protein TnpB [Eubacteriales bacterium]NLM79431.1 IS66 family insertion sequence element accessory protein TnpB [Oscillospiraceae bacterium]
MTQAEKRQQWEQRLLAFEGSGQTVQDWCVTQNIKLSNFYYWRRKLRSGESEEQVNPINWLPLEFDLRPPGEQTAEQIGIEIDGRYKVIVQKGFDRDQLRDVLQVLQQTCLVN